MYYTFYLNSTRIVHDSNNVTRITVLAIDRLINDQHTFSVSTDNKPLHVFNQGCNHYGNGAISAWHWKIEKYR